MSWKACKHILGGGMNMNKVEAGTQPQVLQKAFFTIADMCIDNLEQGTTVSEQGRPIN